jgi:hypothetical protein
MVTRSAVYDPRMRLQIGSATPIAIADELNTYSISCLWLAGVPNLDLVRLSLFDGPSSLSGRGINTNLCIWANICPRDNTSRILEKVSVLLPLPLPLPQISGFLTDSLGPYPFPTKSLLFVLSLSPISTYPTPWSNCFLIRGSLHMSSGGNR